MLCCVVLGCNLCCVVSSELLCCVVLYCDLCCVVLCCAVLCCVVFTKPFSYLTKVATNRTTAVGSRDRSSVGARKV